MKREEGDVINVEKMISLNVVGSRSKRKIVSEERSIVSEERSIVREERKIVREEGGDDCFCRKMFGEVDRVKERLRNKRKSVLII